MQITGTQLWQLGKLVVQSQLKEMAKMLNGFTRGKSVSDPIFVDADASSTAEETAGRLSDDLGQMYFVAFHSLLFS